ncbi:hypothetical protein C0992_005790, partial [Termitomyces sp. T32_za158]
AGLFSATVTAFILESYKSLKPDPSNATIALLTQILVVDRAIAFHNNTPIPLRPASSEFKVPKWAIAVNVLWFLSLTFILTTAVTVTLVQKWVRDYVHRVHHFPQPLKRARMRLFLTIGLDRWKLDELVEYIPALLHISLSLFFIGLCIFMANINTYVVAFVGFVLFCWLVFYCVATFAPLLDPASPLETPLSSIIPYISSFMGQPLQGPVLDLEALREVKAMRPVDPDEVDARAISWTIQRSTDDREREALLACIPDFLRSDDGRKTWKKLLQHREIIALFISGTASLLDVASPLSGAQVNPHEVTRVAICLDALFALLRTTTHRLPPDISVSSLSKPLDRLAHARYQDQTALQTKAICVHALHKHLTETSGMQISAEFWHLGLEADKKLQEVDIMRRTLECDVEKINEAKEMDSGKREKARERIPKALQDYLDAIHSSSDALTRWLQLQRESWDRKEDVKDVLGDWAGYLIEILTIIQKHTDHHGLLLLSYSNIPHLGEGTWNILALLIMAYMRHTGVYSPLPPLPDDHLDLRESFWFHFHHSDDVDKRWIPKAFNQELHLLASALDILAPHRERIQVSGRFITDTEDARTLFTFSHSHSRPRLSTMARPFSLWASIYYATASGCWTRGLSDLVRALRSANFRGNDIQTLTGPIIGETLRILKEGFNSWRSTGSLLFSCSILHKVLSWEREGGVFPFSEANIEYLVNDIFLNILRNLEGLILLPDGSPDGANMIGDLENSEDKANVPLYDLRCLYVAPVQGPSQAAQETSRVLQWLNNRDYRRIVLDKERKRICSRIMEGRRQNISPHATRGDAYYDYFLT